jgi:hypothetical protein
MLKKLPRVAMPIAPESNKSIDSAFVFIRITVHELILEVS